MRSRTAVAAALPLAAVLILATAGTAFAGTMPKTDIPLDGSYLLKGRPVLRQPAKAPVITATTAGTYVPARDPDITLLLPDQSGPDALGNYKPAHYVRFWKEASGDHSDIYVGWADLTPPSTSSQQNHVITQDDIQYMAAEFDGRIWASDVFHFGNYLPRPASDPVSGPRAAIFVYNIRDEAYWGDYRFYIAGFFWGGLNDEIQRNAIFIDSYDWADRTRGTSLRPYLYEGTIAHEFQHLIHNDVDGNEDTFIDEGMADMAEQFIYGTTTTSSHIGEYLFYNRDSLIDWKGELFDYGNAVLWQDYLWEKAGGGGLAPVGHPLAGRVAADKDPFGNDPAKFLDSGDRFTWNLIHDQDNGLQSVATQLAAAGVTDSVEQVHCDYTLANLLDGRVPDPQWNYRNLALGGPDSYGYSVDDGIAFYDSNVAGNMPLTRKNVWRRALTEPWGAYYRTFAGAEPGYTLSFTAPAESGVLPHSAPTEWYSGLGNMVDRAVGRTFSVAAGDALTFWTWFDIEDQWDYGYVEALYPDGQWHVLTQTSALPMATVDVNSSSAWQGPGAFTGNSAGWRQVAFSLAGLSGDVQVRFRYVTDEAANGVGWYVDDATVGATTDPVSSTAGWTNGGWLLTSGLQSNDWTADLWVPYAKAKESTRTLLTLVPVAGSETAGSMWIDTQWIKSGKVYAIVSNRPDGVFDAAARITTSKSK